MDLDSAEILKRLPQAPPFVFVDRIEGARDGRGRALKRFAAEEPWFAWHFPGNPMVPGVLLLESMVQAAGLVHGACGGAPLRVLAEVSRLRLLRPVRPGDRLDIDVATVASFGTLVKFEVAARVGGEPAAEAEITLSARELEK